MESLPPAAQELLARAQRESLAFYKKGYLSNGHHPPLSYYIEVFDGPLLRNRQPAVVAAFTVSVDRVMNVFRRPARAGQDIGGYYAMGRGWIYPDRNGANHRLMLNPGETLYYRFILAPDTPALREMAICSR